MKSTILNLTMILAILFAACNSQNKSNPQVQKVNSIEKLNDMKSLISIFEIPATDISRAINFYQSILDIKIEAMDMEGMQIGLFPFEGQMVFGTIIKGDDYKPSSNGVTIYLNGGDNLQIILDKVKMNGGKIIVTKTLHGDESGYFAIFLDSEGNRIGLHSPN